MRRLITSGLGLKAWPWLRGVDANWRRTFGVPPPYEPFERVLLARQPSGAASTVFYPLVQGYVMFAGGGLGSATGIWCGSKLKPVGLACYSRMVSHSDDNVQGFTNLAPRWALMAGGCESFDRLDNGTDISVAKSRGMLRPLSYAPYTVGAPTTVLKAEWVSLNKMYDVGGDGVLTLEQDAGWAAWAPGLAGAGLGNYPNWVSYPGDNDLYWMRIMPWRSALMWGFDETFHTDRRSYMADMIVIYDDTLLDTYAPPAVVPEGTIDWAGSNLMGYYDPAQSFTQGSSVYRDLSGRNNDLTIGAATYETANGGRFTGSAQAANSYNVSRECKNVTMSMWVYVSANQNWIMMLNGTGADGFGFGQGTASSWDVAGSNLRVLFGGVAFMNAGVMTGLPGWKLITMRIDSAGKVRMFINGASFYNNATYVAGYGSSQLLMQGVAGAMWGVSAVWDSALTDQQILDNFNNTKARYGL